MTGITVEISNNLWKSIFQEYVDLLQAG